MQKILEVLQNFYAKTSANFEVGNSGEIKKNF